MSTFKIDNEQINSSVETLRTLLEECKEAYNKKIPESTQDKGQTHDELSELCNNLKTTCFYLGELINNSILFLGKTSDMFEKSDKDSAAAISGGDSVSSSTYDKNSSNVSSSAKDEQIIINENPDYTHQFKFYHKPDESIIIPPKSNKQGHRSADAYREVMSALDVENNFRYQEVYNPYYKGTTTCCNVYVWDVLVAMDCKIPSKAFSCGAMRDWMASDEGVKSGWVEVDQNTAIAMANEGYPTVAADTVGDHVAMVAPQRGADQGVYLSQAGWKNFDYLPQSWGWSSSYSIRYFYHK